MSHTPKTVIVMIVTTFAAAAGIALTSAPAHATAADCIAYLEDQGQQTTARNEVCTTTEFLADTVSQSYAEEYCHLTMTATGLDATRTDEACARALED